MKIYADELLNYIKINSHSFFDIQILFIVISAVFILLIYAKRFHYIFTELVWIYSALLPALSILFFNHIVKETYLFFYLSLNVTFIVLYFKDIIKNYFILVNVSTNPKSKVKEIINEDYGKNKSLEYVGLFILPFITVNDSVNLFTIIFILLIVILIIKRFELFYLNLPILFLFKIQVVLTNKNVKMMVLTRRNFNFILDQEYDVRSFIKSLKLYIYLEK